MTALRRSLLQTFRIKDPTPDAVLIRAAIDGDQDSLAALIERHGPMVLRVCRNVLRDEHDAEDVVQAVFLLLSRRLGRLKHPDRLAAWLFGTARNMALNSRTANERRRRRESRSKLPAPINALDDISGRELLIALDEEIERLPDSYRLPLLLTYWQGLKQDEAARRLGWTQGSVKGRLERGRKMLADRLTRRGLAPTVLLTASLSSVAMPADLAARTVSLIVPGATIPGAVLALVAGGGVMKSTSAAAIALVLLVVGSVTGLALKQDTPAPAEKPPPQPLPGVVGAPARLDLFGDPLPEGVVARLGSARLRHPRALAVAFTPNGRLVSAGADGQIRFWEIATGRSLKRRSIENEHLNWGPALLSANGERVIFQEGEQVVVHDTGTGEKIESLPLLKSLEVSAAMSADGRTVAAQDYDGRIQIWEPDRNRSRELGALGPSRSMLRFAQDGRTIVGAHTYGPIVVWEVATGKELLRIKSIAKSSIESVDLSEDALAVLLTRPKGSVEFFRISTGAAADGLVAPPVRDDRWVQFAPDGKNILIGGEKQWREWDPRTGKIVRTFEGGAFRGVVFSPDGKLAAASGGTVLRIWDVGTGKQRHSELDADSPMAEVKGVAVAADGRTIATSAYREIRFWDGVTGRTTARITALQRFGRPIAFESNGNLFASADDGRGVALYDAKGRELRRFSFGDATGPHGTVWNLRLSADGKSLAAVTQFEESEVGTYGLSVWDVASANRIVERRISFGSAHPGYGALSPDLRKCVAGNSIWRLDRDGARRKLDVTEQGAFTNSAFSPDGRLVAVSLGEKTIRRLPDGGESHSLEPRGVGVFDAMTGQRIAHLNTGESGQLAFSPDGREIAVAGRASLGVWTISTGKQRLSWASHTQAQGSYGISSASSMCYSPDGRRLVTGHIDNTALVREVLPVARVAKALSDSDRAALWTDLSGDDAPKAYRAVITLSDDPGAVEFLAPKVKPAAVDRARLDKLVIDLDSASFQNRKSAAKDLSNFGSAAIPMLEEAKNRSTSVDAKNRLQQLIETLADNPTSIEIDQLRLLHALELIGTPAARECVRKQANGSPGSRITEAAADALRRMGGGSL